MERRLFGDAAVMYAGVAGFGNKVDWRSWQLLPACDQDVPRFFEHLLAVHVTAFHGSEELQLLVHALRFGLLQDSGRYRQLHQSIIEQMQVGSKKRRPDVQQWVPRCAITDYRIISSTTRLKKTSDC